MLCSSGIAEHWCSGTVTLNIPWLNELVKENFIEISEQLAKKIGVKAGDKVKVSSARSSVVVKAMVTKRAQPLTVNGEEIELSGETVLEGDVTMVSTEIEAFLL